MEIAKRLVAIRKKKISQKCLYVLSGVPYATKRKFENTEEMMNLTAAYCRRLGLEPYYLYRQKNMAGNFENVGYAKPGKAGIYNILIMEEKQTIVAMGAGSTTKAVFPGGRIERCDNVKDIDLYLERIDEMIDRKRKLLS